MDQYDTILPSGTGNVGHMRHPNTIHMPQQPQMAASSGGQQPKHNPTNQLKAKQLAEQAVTGNNVTHSKYRVYIIGLAMLVSIIFALVAVYYIIKHNNNSTVDNTGRRRTRSDLEDPRCHVREQLRPRKSSISQTLLDKYRKKKPPPVAEPVRHDVAENSAEDPGMTEEEADALIDTHLAEEIQDSPVQVPKTPNVSDEEEEHPAQPGSEVVAIDIVPQTCQFILVGGKRMGQLCGRKCVAGNDRCNNHIGKEN